MTPAQHIAVALIDLVAALVAFAAFTVAMVVIFGWWFSLYAAEVEAEEKAEEGVIRLDSGWNR